MPTNLAIEDELLIRALKIRGHKTKKATVTEEYIRRHKQLQLFELAGKMDYDPDYYITQSKKF